MACCKKAESHSFIFPLFGRWKAQIYRAELDQLKKWGKRNKTSTVPVKRASALSCSITTATREHDQKKRLEQRRRKCGSLPLDRRQQNHYAEQKWGFDGSRQTVAKGSVPSLTGMCHSSRTGKGSAMRSAEQTISVAAHLHGFAPLLGLN